MEEKIKPLEATNFENEKQKKDFYTQVMKYNAKSATYCLTLSLLLWHTTVFAYCVQYFVSLSFNYSF